MSILAIRLRGGMGNQLFQYAAAFRLALTNGLVLGVDGHTGFRNDPYRRTYALDNFCISGKLLDIREAAEYLTSFRTSRLTYKTVEYLAREIRGTTFVEVLARLRTRGGMLEGYFQHPQYFADVSEEIRSEFRFSSQMDSAVTALHRDMSSSESVALHVRRLHGNTHGRQAELYGLPALYYESAFRLLSKSLHNPRVFVFGDRPEWAQTRLSLGTDITLVKHDSARVDVEDLRLMASCKHHIISNSTFSWWGAWLAQQGGNVYCPRDFSPDQKGHYRDAYPANWIVV